MNWDALSAVADLITSVAMIGSLIYIAIQIKRERDATLANTRQLRAAGAREIFLTLATSPHLAATIASLPEDLPFGAIALMEKYNMDREQAIRLSTFSFAGFRQSEANWRIAMTDAERDQFASQVAVSLFGHRKVWWDAMKPSFAPDFVAAIDRYQDGPDISGKGLQGKETGT